MTGTTAAEPVFMSVQARLDQLEAAIREAHGQLNRITPGDTQAMPPSAEGLLACADRCNSEAHGLVMRLSDLAEKIGIL